MKLSEKLSHCFTPLNEQAQVWSDFCIHLDDEAKIAYYPSSGSDYRPFLFLQMESLSYCKVNTDSYKEPDLFIFSDSDYNDKFIDISDFLKSAREFIKGNPGTSHRYYQGKVSNVLFSGFPYSNIVISSFCELKFNTSSFNYESKPEYAMCRKKGAIYFKAEIEFLKLDNTKTINCIYLGAENINVLDQLFVRHNISISHLIWINDGFGTIGGNRISHKFLPPLCTKLNTEFIFTHYDLHKDEDFEKPRELRRILQNTNSPDAELIGNLRWNENLLVEVYKI